MKYKVGNKVKFKPIEWLKENVKKCYNSDEGSEYDFAFHRETNMIDYHWLLERIDEDAIIDMINEETNSCYILIGKEKIGVWAAQEWLEDEQAEPTLFDRIKSAIIEAAKQAPIIIEQTEDGGVKISPIEEKEDDLPIDTPCVVSTKIGVEFGDWNVRYYAGKNTCYVMGTNSKTKRLTKPLKSNWDYIIPFDKFNPNDIEESLKHNIVK